MATTRKPHADQPATGRSGDDTSAGTGGRSHHDAAHHGRSHHDEQRHDGSHHDGSHHDAAHHDGSHGSAGMASMTLPHLDLADMGRRIGHTVGALRANLPPTERLLYYGGLGAAVVAGMVDLPVGVAIGAGVWVATRTRQGRHRTATPGGLNGPNGAKPNGAGH